MPDLTVELEYRNGNVRFRDGDGRFVSYSPSNSGNTIEMPSVINTIPSILLRLIHFVLET